MNLKIPVYFCSNETNEKMLEKIELYEANHILRPLSDEILQQEFSKFSDDN